MSRQAVRRRALVLLVVVAAALGVSAGGAEAAPTCTNPGGQTLPAPPTEQNPHCAPGGH